MKIKNKIICVLVLCLTITLSTLGIRTNVFALENNETVYEAKVYNSATIEDNFDGRSIIVILDKSIRGNLKRQKSFPLPIDKTYNVW